jgi:hypothetical protein
MVTSKMFFLDTPTLTLPLEGEGFRGRESCKLLLSRRERICIAPGERSEPGDPDSFQETIFVPERGESTLPAYAVII